MEFKVHISLPNVGGEEGVFEVVATNIEEGAMGNILKIKNNKQTRWRWIIMCNSQRQLLPLLMELLKKSL